MKRFIVAAVCLLALVGGPSAAAQPAASQSFYVDATTYGWQPTGVFLKKHHSVEIIATGESCAIRGVACYGPNGAGINMPTDGPYANAPSFGGPAYALVGMVGDQMVFIGEGPTMVAGSGELLLAFNDDRVTDNSGGYSVTITMCRPGNGHGDQNHCRSGPPGQS